jgi:hypothetical protein
MGDSFKDQVKKWAEESEKTLFAILKQSIDTTVKIANTPRGEKGGNMPVRTGFLRMSGSAALNEIPVGETLGEKDKMYTANYANDVPLILAQMKQGDVFYWGWTAEYANRQNVYCGFLDSAVDRWQITVNESVKKVKK